MQISIIQYEQLSKQQLYALLQLRQRVFIQEQQSIYDDIDGNDQQAYHLLLEQDNVLGGYARFRVADDQNKVLVERVVLAPESRGSGAGKDIMVSVLAFCSEQFPQKYIQLSAQIDVLAFYQKLGFEAIGEPYDDGGILHKTMILRK